MKIVDVKVQLIRRPMPDIPGLDFTIGNTSFFATIAEQPVFRIFTDEGIEGTSCGRGGKVAAQALASMKPFLLGEDPLYVERIWQKIWKLDRVYRLPESTQGTIDVALWDIVGKKANLPIFQLLGAYRDRVKAYASSMHHPRIEQHVNEALEAKAQGFTAYKIHVPCIPEEDLAICRAVREAVGDDMILMLDVTGLYTRQQALMVGRELEKLNFYWFEEPIPDSDMDGLIELSRILDIPIAITIYLVRDLRRCTCNRYPCARNRV